MGHRPGIALTRRSLLLWAALRGPRSPCFFRVPVEDCIAFEDRLTRAIWDAFPLSEGHLPLVPRRHVPTWFDATADEQAALMEALERGRQLLAAARALHGHGPSGDVRDRVRRGEGDPDRSLHLGARGRSPRRGAGAGPPGRAQAAG